jgi:hypothetical protein
MDVYLIHAFASLVVGIVYLSLAPFFLYIVIWWLPIILPGTLMSILKGESSLRDDLEFLSPFCLIRGVFPDNKKLQIGIGLTILALTCIGMYIFWKENNDVFFYVTLFIGVTMLLGIIHTLFEKNL